MIDTIQKNMFDNGYCKFSDPDVFIHLKDIDSWEWLNRKDQGLQLIKRSVEVQLAMDLTQQLLAEKYVKHLDANYQLGSDCEIVNGMDDATLSWHNDNMEGYNLAILLYLDTLDSDTGGAVFFRNIETQVVTGGFYPSHYDVSFMNHNTKFEHIVNSLKMDLPRRVATFNYIISKNITG